MQHTPVITRRFSVPCFREPIDLTRRSLVAPAEVAWHLLPARLVLHLGRRACNSSSVNAHLKMRTHRRDFLNGWQVKQSSAGHVMFIR